MGKNRNRNRRTNTTSANLFHSTDGSSRSNNETTFTGGARPKLVFSTPVRHATQKTSYGTLSHHLEEKFQKDINGCVEEYEALIIKFHNAYNLWSFRRKRAICELKDLVENVHRDQLAFNSSNLLFKQINVGSRCLKNGDGSNLDFFASLATLATDVIGGVTSIAQACNIDKYTKEFNEIMEKDIEYTKPLYDARSSCFAKYKDVEEIVRNYHSETIGSTLNKISNTLKVDDMWLDIKAAKSGDNIIQALEVFDNFFRIISRDEVFGGVCKTVSKYIDNNPAVLEACESTGKALYGALEMWSDKKNSSLLTKSIRLSSNRALMSREEAKISKLKYMVNNEDISQAKLESTIQEALEGLEAETREIEMLYRDSLQLISSKKKVNNYDCDSDDDCDYFQANYHSSYFS